MNEEELNDIQELIERKLLMAEVMGGLTSHDKKFINLWNYTIQLQNNWNELKKWVKEYEENSYGLGSYETGIADGLGDVLKKMQELENGNNGTSNEIIK